MNDFYKSPMTGHPVNQGGTTTFVSQYDLEKVGVKIYEPRNPGGSGIDG